MILLSIHIDSMLVCVIQARAGNKRGLFCVILYEKINIEEKYPLNIVLHDSHIELLKLPTKKCLHYQGNPQIFHIVLMSYFMIKNE